MAGCSRVVGIRSGADLFDPVANSAAQVVLARR